MPVSKEQWQNYVMQQYYLQSLDPDPKISKAALDSLAKTSIVGLHEERKEITLELKSTIDLQSEALTLLRSLAQRNNEKTGVAFERIESSMQKGTFHYTDHGEYMVRRVGVILENLIEEATDLLPPLFTEFFEVLYRLVRVHEDEPR